MNIFILHANHGKNNQKNTIFHQFQCKLDVPAATMVSKMTHPYLEKKSSRFNGFISCPCLVLSISPLSFCGHGELNECSQIIQTEDVTHAGVRRWTQSDLGGVHMRFRHAPLTSQTMPPLPHSQSNGVHSQIPSSLKPRLRDPNTTRLTVPFLLDWTSILPPRLLKTEPPTDATPCLLIY